MRRYFFWFGFLAIIVLVLYDIKYSVHTAQSETRALEAQLLKERERLQMVELEWTMLTRPERIAALTAKHLSLKPILTEQLMVEDAAMWKASTMVSAVDANGAIVNDAQSLIQMRGETLE
jgi:hypothetical protein